MASKSVRILDMLEQAGEAGMEFGEAQEALWLMSHPDQPFTRQLRGYWCTNLCGGAHYHPGLFRFFATKGQDGLWRRNDRPHHGHPWAVMKHPERYGITVQRPGRSW